MGTGGSFGAIDCGAGRGGRAFAPHEAAASFGPEMAALLERKLGEPKGGWTNRNLIRAGARVGGFIGRKSAGEPGWQTIWRGWQQLIWMGAGANLMEDKKRCR